MCLLQFYYITAASGRQIAPRTPQGRYHRYYRYRRRADKKPMKTCCAAQHLLCPVSPRGSRGKGGIAGNPTFELWRLWVFGTTDTDAEVSAGEIIYKLAFKFLQFSGCGLPVHSNHRFTQRFLTRFEVLYRSRFLPGRHLGVWRSEQRCILVFLFLR